MALNALPPRTFERQHGGQIQRQRHLDQRADHVVEAQLQGGKRVGTGEDVDVVLEADELARADVLHLVERVADHGSEWPVSEDYEQRDRNRGKGDDDARLTPISGLLVEWNLGLLGRFHCCCSHDIPLFGLLLCLTKIAMEEDFGLVPPRTSRSPQ